MKKIASKFLIAIIVSLTLLSAKTNQAKEDFSGTWKLNVSNSNFDTLKSDIAPKEIIAKQSFDSIIVIKTFEHPGVKPNTYSQSFYYFGKPSERIAGGIERRVTTISTSNDTLIFNMHAYIDNKGFKWEYASVEKWNLSGDGKTLTIQRRAVFPDRMEAYKAVYDQQ